MSDNSNNARRANFRRTLCIKVVVIAAVTAPKMTLSRKKSISEDTTRLYTAFQSWSFNNAKCY